jgi:hypothetical protein
MGKLTKWFAQSKEALTSDEVFERLRRVERAIELQYVDKPQADVDKALSEGAAELIRAFEKSNVAVAQLGSLLILKVPDQSGSPAVLVRTLTRRELTIIENNPELLTDPANLLKSLRDQLRLSGAECDVE